MKKNIAVILRYDGRAYSGLQRQSVTDETIQGKLEQVLAELFQQPVELTASGRTDAGVHAWAQPANFVVETDLSAREVLEELNRRLPADLAVVRAREAAPRFHSRLGAKWKHYRYTVRAAAKPDVFRRDYQWHVEGTLSGKAMREAATALFGEHDFAAFTDKKLKDKSTVRKVYLVEITGKELPDDVPGALEWTFDYFGNSFLNHMVRLLTGALVAAGQGQLGKEALRQMLETGERTVPFPLAPAQGLMLMEVGYEAWQPRR